MRPVVYEIEKGVRCEETMNGWFIHRENVDSPYWRKSGWHSNGPDRFKTAQQARKAYRAKNPVVPDAKGGGA